MVKHGKRYIHEAKPGRFYVRVKGRYKPLSIDGAWLAPGTAEFDTLYWEILRGKRAEARTSWVKLIASYRSSDRWSNLSHRTRADYERVLLYIEERLGTRDVSDLRRSHVIDAQSANAHRVRFANYIPQVMSVLCEHAIDIGWIEENHAKGVRRLVTPDSKRQEHIPWTDKAIETFRADASPECRLIFEIGIGSVQRPGDWIKFGWSDFDGDSLHIVQGKTGRALEIPCTERLRAALRAAPRKGMTILTKKDGRPLPYRRMAEMMRRERVRLGVEAYDLHALRYRGVMELAWAGCNDDEIASYSGHTSKEMIAKYAGIARQQMRARSARGKRR